MIIVNGRLESTPEDVAALKDVLATMENASRAEDGCTDYTFSTEINNPGVIRITERWRDLDALAAHFRSPHMAAFQKAMRAHPPSASAVTFFEATEVAPPRP